MIINPYSFPAVGGGTPDLLNETFEATGWTGLWWTGGSANPDFTGDPLAGAQSLEVASGELAAWLGATDYDEVWGRFLFKCPSSVPSSFYHILATRSTGFSNNYQATLLSTGKLSPDGGSTLTTDSLSANVLYYIWWHYKKGTGANDVSEVWFDTVATRPASGGSKHATKTGQGHTSPFGHLLPATSVEAARTVIFDEIQIATTDIYL